MAGEHAVLVHFLATTIQLPHSWLLAFLKIVVFRGLPTKDKIDEDSLSKLKIFHIEDNRTLFNISCVKEQYK